MDRLLDSRNLMLTLNGSPDFLGTISSTGTSAVNPFTIPVGSTLLIQTTAPLYIKPGVSTTTVANSDGLLLAQDEKFYLTLTRDQSHVAVISVSGTASVKVWRMR